MALNHVSFNRLPAMSRLYVKSLGINDVIWEEIWKKYGRGSYIQYNLPLIDICQIPSNPIQCNTSDNAKRWLIQRDRKYRPTHRLLHVGVLPNGMCYLLDGHTRIFMWQHDMLDLPPDMCVDMDIIGCADMKEIEERYREFDNIDAAKDSKDYLASAYNKFGLNPKSALIQTRSIGSALKMAYLFYTSGIAAGQYVNIDILDAYSEFDKEVRLFDSIRPTKDKFITPITAAALISIRRYGVYILDDFWKPYQNDAGRSDSGFTDAIFRLTQRRKEIRDRKENPSSYQVDVFELALQLVKIHMNRLEENRDTMFLKVRRESHDVLKSHYLPDFQGRNTVLKSGLRKNSNILSAT